MIDNEVNAQLLQELDGIKTTDAQPVFVFASTNRPELIDPAILQRFTDRIEIGLPTFDERLKLLDVFIGKIPIGMEPPEDEREMEAKLEAHGYTVDDGADVPYEDLKLFVLSYKRKALLDLGQKESREEALSVAWFNAMSERGIFLRLASATDGQSGRQLKNMVTKATMKAVQRSAKTGGQRVVTLLASDFEELV